MKHQNRYDMQTHAKNTLISIILVLALVGSIAWAAIAPGMQALIPTFTAIASGIALVDRNTNYIRYYN